MKKLTLHIFELCIDCSL